MNTDIDLIETIELRLFESLGRIYLTVHTLKQRSYGPVTLLRMRET